tara:strand:+ start:1421 stop:1573 length:153 start_codon:yes stop_codon:yes gene_type:complete
MKYKIGQKVDIGDGTHWKIIGYEDGLIEIETIDGDHLFVDESEIVRGIEE